MTTINITVTKTEKLRAERQAKRYGMTVPDFFRLAVKKFEPGIDWDNLPEENTADYKPEFLRNLKRAMRDIHEGRVKTLKTLSDL